uniref:Uncharacterized protein n=1 Tax=Romanomermis culicivorax TaxID=13658 RepID=A0A915HM25_ROMCU
MSIPVLLLIGRDEKTSKIESVFVTEITIINSSTNQSSLKISLSRFRQRIKNSPKASGNEVHEISSTNWKIPLTNLLADEIFVSFARPNQTSGMFFSFFNHYNSWNSEVLPLRIDDRKSYNENVVVERLLNKSVNNNVQDRAQIFEKIAQKQKKPVAQTTTKSNNNLPFLKKIGNYFSSKLSTNLPSNSESGKKLQQRSQTLRLPMDANKDQNEEFPDDNNVLRSFSENFSQKYDFRLPVTEKRQNVINDGSDDEENTDNLPAHEDKSSKMNISEKTKLFELKSQIHMKKQDDVDNYSKKRVSFVENGHCDQIGAEKSLTVNQRRKFRTNNERRKTQPVTQGRVKLDPNDRLRVNGYIFQQAEIDKARTLSQSASDVNYQAYRFIQTGLERATSKSSVDYYNAPNFKVKDDETCKKQAKQLSRCKKVSLW